MSKDKKVSVIIRAKNEERWIGHAIQSVIDHIDSPEIIIIDNHSSDETLAIARTFQADPELENSNRFTEVKIVSIDDYSPGKALNLGVQHSSNEYILILSSHCVLKEFNLKKHVSDSSKYAAIFGNQIPKYNGRTIQKRYLWSHFGDVEVVNMFSDMEDRYFFHNALSFFKKDTLIQEPFNEVLTGKEDRYWAIDIIKEKKDILYDPSMSADHHYTPNGNTWKGIG